MHIAQTRAPQVDASRPWKPPESRRYSYVRLEVHMLEAALISFAAILVTWLFAPDAPRAAAEPRLSGSIVPAQA